MKKNCSMRSAFFIPRVLIGFALSLISVALALFAFGLTPLNNSNSLTDTQGWFHQLASALGVHLDSQKLASLPAPKGGGAGVPLSKIPGEPLQGMQDQTAANYTGPHNNFRPVEGVRTRPLRELPKIP